MGFVSYDFGINSPQIKAYNLQFNNTLAPYETYAFLFVFCCYLSNPPIVIDVIMLASMKKLIVEHGIRNVGVIFTSKMRIVD